MEMAHAISMMSSQCLCWRFPHDNYPPPNKNLIDGSVEFIVSVLPYVTVLRKNGLIAGLVKIDFFPEMASTKLRYCLSKYERFTKLSFHAMTLNSRPFAVIAFLMFEENAFRVCC